MTRFKFSFVKLFGTIALLCSAIACAPAQESAGKVFESAGSVFRSAGELPWIEKTEKSQATEPSKEEELPKPKVQASEGNSYERPR